VTLEGATFDGYRLLRLLGHGGAGEVYLADSPVDGPVAGQVALKLYHDARSEPVAVDLMRQIQLAATLKHPSILPCYNNAIQGNDMGVVMAYAPGGSLGDTLNNSASKLSLPLRPAVVAQIISQVARTLADVHGRGLIHGDLKPTNLFVRTAPNGSPIVAISDFGHAFLAHAAVASFRRDRSAPPEWAVEQLAWAAPEQLRGSPMPASDQYSLAALAYYLLTGIRPVSAEAQSVMSGGAPRSIIPPSRLNPALDDEMDAVLLHALAPLPLQRFSDVVEFAHALDDALATDETQPSGDGGSPLASTSHGSRGESAASRAEKRTLTQMRFAAVTPGATQTRSRSAVARNAVRPSPAPGMSRVKRVSRALRIPRGPRLSSEPQMDAPDSLSTSTNSMGSMGLSRHLSTLSARALLVAVVIVVLGVLAFTTNVGDLRARLNLSSQNSASPTQSASTPQSTTQTQAQKLLRTALASKPVYSDALTGTPAEWSIDGKAVFFGADQRLHLLNTLQAPLFADMPTSATIPQGAYIASVDVAVIKGNMGDHAGIRFLASSSTKGDTYYSYLMTSDGHFEVWLQQPDTGLVFLTSGFAPSLKAGIGQANTLAVLVDPTANSLTLFANGAFVFEAPIRSGVPMTGRLGVMTPDNSVEAAFADFAVYKA
jgi:serine/threonine protein kinase